MRAAEVLSIDVDAELREVSREQLQGDWQLPAELIRFALRRGAVEIAVRRSRRGFSLRCPGAECALELAQAAVAFDPSRPAADRHQAIVAIEKAGANALLWAAGVPDGSLRIANRSGGSATVLELRPGCTPRLEEDAADEVAGGLEVRFAAPRFPSRQALDWLATACRFTPATVTVAGRPVRQGFLGAIRSVSLGRPLPGGLALTTTGDAPHLWLLRHGVLAARATVPAYPPFEAVLDLGEVTHEGVGADELRRAAQPALAFILDRVADLIVEAAADDDAARDPALASRLCTLGLRAIRSGLARARLTEQPLVPIVAPPGSGPARLSIAALQRLAAGTRTPLMGVPPGERGKPRTGAGSEPVLIVDVEQQRLLVDLLGARVERPEPRPRLGQGAAGEPLAAAAAWARAAAASLLGSRVLASAELIDAERRLLGRLDGAVLDELGRALAVHLVAGVGPVRRKGPALLLPRHNPMVGHAVRLAADDESWLYPVVLALAAGRGRPAPALRERWSKLNVER